ncbi:hypothetical protein WSM22_26420 [Cytophagales bacterium WSM2-2]|nr:hypothetical protein WSM22_26420 [Cytophagales bacterium WSM2-2]
MKKYFSLATLLTLLSLTATSQIRNSTYYSRDNINLFPDSIRVEFPDEQAFVVFELKEYNGNRTLSDFNTNLKDLIFYIKKTSNDKDFTITPHQAKVVFNGNGDKEIEVASTKSIPTKLSIKNNQMTELLPPGWEIIIRKADSKIYIYGKNLDSIEKIVGTDFSLVTTKINGQSLQSIGRKSIKARLIVRNGIVENADIEIKHPGDFLFVHPAVGFGFVSDAFYPSFTLGLAAIFRDRYGRKNHMIKLSEDYLLFTRRRLDGKLTVGPNMGISLSYGANYAKNSVSPLWMTVGVGVISNHRNNTAYDTYFRGNTMRIFASFDVRNNFTIIPEMFLTDDVSNQIYGLRLNFNLP